MRSTLQAIVLLVLLASACYRPQAYGHRASPLPVPRDSNIFIDQMDGFGSDLKAALLRKSVRLDIVSSKSMADFEVTGTIQDATHKTPSVSILVWNLKTHQMVGGYGVTGIADWQSAAALCANQMKKGMEQKH
jgi:hypothetical protein